MATTLEILETRLTAVETELRDLREQVAPRSKSRKPTPMPKSRLDELLGDMKANQAEISAGIAEAFTKMGITGKPIGAKNVREMIAAEGIIDPNDNECSRGIIEMREE